MANSVEVLSEQYGCWGEGTWLYYVRYQEQCFQVSIASLLDRDSRGAAEAYWADVREWHLITDEVPLVQPTLPEVGIDCSTRDEAYGAAIRVITGAGNHNDNGAGQSIKRRPEATRAVGMRPSPS